MSEIDDKAPGWEGPLDAAIMFVDLVDSSAFSSVLGLKEYADQMVSDEDFKARKTRFPYNPPETKEYYLLRTYFDKFFPGERARC